MFIFQVIRNTKYEDKQSTKHCLSLLLFCSYNSLKGIYCIYCKSSLSLEVFIQHFCEITKGAVIKSSGPGYNRAELWLLLPCSADFSVYFKPFCVFSIFGSLNAKFLA